MSDDQLMETGRLAELGLQASTLVHELRQPTFAIKAMAQVLLETSEGNATETLTRLIQQVEVLEQLIARYGDASQRPTGAPEPIDLVHAITGGIDVVRGHRADIELQWHPPNAPVFAAVDPIAVQQITSNLVRNAVDAARSKVVVNLEGTVLQITDDGPGILPDIEAKLGQPFVTSKPPGEGTGLGLAVTRSLVEVIGGRFSWETGPNGTSFEVDLNNG